MYTANKGITHQDPTGLNWANLGPQWSQQQMGNI